MSSENLINIDLKKEKKKEYMKEYDKDRIRPLYYQEQRKEKTFCFCGCLIKRGNQYLHITTKKHEETLKKQTPENLLSIQESIKKIDEEYKLKYDEKKKEEQTKKEKEKLEREERLKKIREKMENNQRTIIYCPCGSQFQRKEKNRHEKCQNHIQYLQLQQNK